MQSTDMDINVFHFSHNLTVVNHALSRSIFDKVKIQHV